MSSFSAIIRGNAYLCFPGPLVHEATLKNPVEFKMTVLIDRREGIRIEMPVTGC